VRIKQNKRRREGGGNRGLKNIYQQVERLGNFYGLTGSRIRPFIKQGKNKNSEAIIYAICG
jgi:hypothetical protein